VINLINSLKINKAVRHDDIPSYFLRIGVNVLALTICRLCDAAFKLGIFPFSCKIARVVPLYKSENKDEMSNYRLISILTCFCKIIEKLIYHRFINFFGKHSVFIKSQYGFRNNLSTTHAALDIVINAFDQINHNHYSCLVFLDYKKAFDTVCHNIFKSISVTGNNSFCIKVNNRIW